MNRDEVKGTVTELGGRAKEAVGEAIGNNRVRTDGIVDQVAGATQHAYGVAKERVADVADAGRAYYDEGVHAISRRVEEQPMGSLLTVGLIGFIVGWLCRGRN
ncbi:MULTISPECIES: CsbD family protein [unclassified Chelatococcus]|uniref:CsbD family protein n=1 Tax=unclassified Chelatococcus TaxID=2638111 RepID=UPI001BD0E561|nr:MULTISPECIES: CsbD family protein [unclassified Chelatococcus]MBS7698388.1 CsbD family protein [Chelatococcus sp. YT9]MBX3558845.1 CsbD family protein [Chelatococcus sp.]